MKLKLFYLFNNIFIFSRKQNFSREKTLFFYKKKNISISSIFFITLIIINVGIFYYIYCKYCKDSGIKDEEFLQNEEDLEIKDEGFLQNEENQQSLQIKSYKILDFIKIKIQENQGFKKKQELEFISSLYYNQNFINLLNLLIKDFLSQQEENDFSLKLIEINFSDFKKFLEIIETLYPENQKNNFILNLNEYKNISEELFLSYLLKTYFNNLFKQRLIDHDNHLFSQRLNNLTSSLVNFLNEKKINL